MAAVAVSGLVLGAAQLLGALEVVLPALPLLLLLASLLAGIYPGCDAIVRLAERRARSPRRSTAGAARPRPRLAHAIGGGMLIASGHPQRPPPLLV